MPEISVYRFAAVFSRESGERGNIVYKSGGLRKPSVAGFLTGLCGAGEGAVPEKRRVAAKKRIGGDSGKRGIIRLRGTSASGESLRVSPAPPIPYPGGNRGAISAWSFLLRKKLPSGNSSPDGEFGT